MAQDSGQLHVGKPGPPLSEFVDTFWICQDYVQPHAQERLLPTGAMQLVFALDAEGRALSGVAGARSEVATLDTSRPLSAIGVHFRPGGGFPFFGLPAGELHNRNVPLDVLWGGSAATVSDRLWEAETPERRFRILEGALLDRARDRLDGHPAVRYALDQFDRSNGARPVGDVVQRIGVSPRRFIELFRNQVGLTPKAFCRIRRFNEALRRIERLTDVDWVDIALSCGYFDQAHFNHDFRAFSGINPSTYLRHRTSRTHVAVTG
jgi:AraC-like DNA-binding protein